MLEKETKAPSWAFAAFYADPLTLGEAANHIQSWLNRGVTRIMLADSHHMDRVVQLLQAAGSVGSNLVTDAQIAALAIPYKAEVHTADRDFLRFPALTCRFPLAEH